MFHDSCGANISIVYCVPDHIKYLGARPSYIAYKLHMWIPCMATLVYCSLTGQPLLMHESQEGLAETKSIVRHAL